MSSAVPKISVITASYNQGQYIAEAMDSVLAQRYPSVEHIVIDGGSTDNSCDVISHYDKHLAYWVSEKDRGQTHAINKGIERATGDLLLVLNSDDVVLPGAFDAVADEFMRDPKLRWLSGTSLYFGPGIPSDLMPCRTPADPIDWLLNKWCIPHPSTYLRREVMEKHGAYDESFYFTMDYEYWLRLVFGGERCKGIQRPLSGFRYHDASKTVSAQDQRQINLQMLVDKYKPMLSPADQRTFDQRLLISRASDGLYGAVHLLNKGEKEAAISLWRETMKKYPAAKFSRPWLTSWAHIFLLGR